MKTAAEFLDEAAKTFRQRNAIYGNNFLNIGTVMSGLFPGGLTLNTPDEWNRLHILLLQAVKLSRYCNNWDTEGPEADEIRRDSMMDNTVYSAILESIDRMIAGRNPPPSPLEEFLKHIFSEPPSSAEVDKWFVDTGAPDGDRSVLSVVTSDGEKFNVVFSTCAECKSHYECANKRKCRTDWHLKLLPGNRVKFVRLAPVYDALSAERMEGMKKYLGKEARITTPFNRMNEDNDTKRPLCQIEFPGGPSFWVSPEMIAPVFMPCSSCDMQELCGIEKHCDKTGNGYR